jgi:acyl carrier protein
MSRQLRLRLLHSSSILTLSTAGSIIAAGHAQAQFAGIMTPETLDEVKRIIAKRLDVPVERLANDTRLDELGATSLEIIEIVFDIEEKFGINVPIQPGESSLVLKSETAGAESTVQLGTIGETARIVQSLVEAKKSRQ